MRGLEPDTAVLGESDLSVSSRGKDYLCITVSCSLDSHSYSLRFLKRDSLLNKAKDMGDAEVEERKERIEQPRKGYD